MGFESITQFPTPERQFESPETMEFGEDEARVYDISPESPKTETPVWFAGGWGSTPEMFRENILALAEKGRRVLAAEAPHGIEPDADLREHAMGETAEAELRKVAAIIRTLDAKGIDKVDSVANSEAGLFVTLAAAMYPERFRSIVYSQPAGMVGEYSPAKLALNFSLDCIKGTLAGIADGKIVARNFRGGRIIAASVLKDPVASAQEVLAMGNAEMHELLAGLKERGIGISIIHATDDEAFPMARVQEIVTSDMVDGFYAVPGRHAETLTNPTGMSALADQAFDAMAKNAEARRAETEERAA